MTKSKYRAESTEADGIRFHSKKEARRYEQLKLLVRANEISGLELQPRFELHAITGKRVASYVADFSYVEHVRPHEYRKVVEDVKGVITPIYRLKKKLFEAEYGIEVRET